MLIYMGRVIFIVCFFLSMVLWDVILRFLTVISRTLARDYVDKKIPRYAKRLFSIARTFAGMKFQRSAPSLRGLPEYFLILSNHQSFIDIAVLITSFHGKRLRFVAKEELAHWIPFVSPQFRLQRHALISRKGNIRKSMRQLLMLARMARKGYCPVVFPEGTRSRDGNLLPFHSGAVRTMLQANPMPVLCVALDGGYHVASFSHLFENMRYVDYRIAVQKLFPPPENVEEINSVLSESRDLINRQLEQWRGQ